jgi:hypothetical protein
VVLFENTEALYLGSDYASSNAFKDTDYNKDGSYCFPQYHQRNFKICLKLGDGSAFFLKKCLGVLSI